MLSSKKKIALAYLLGRLGRSQKREQVEDSDDDVPPRKRQRSEENTKRTRRDQQDEFGHFSESLAMQLRRLPGIEAARLMREMQSLVTEKKIELDNKSNLERAAHYVSSDGLSEEPIEDSRASYEYTNGEDPIGPSNEQKVKPEGDCEDDDDD